MKQKKALLISHSLTAVTGFGNQHWLLARALADAGWKVYGVCKDYHGEVIECKEGTHTENGKDLSGITILPWGEAPWLEDKTEFYVRKYRPDIVYTLGDIWCYQHITKLPKDYPWYWIANYEFDTENMVGFWHQNVRNADISVVPAKFAYEMLRDAGHKNAIYLPHGVDTEVFKPMTYDEKCVQRKKFGFPDSDFIISCVAHNQQRKMLARLLRAFKKFSEGKDDVTLFMHTQMKDFTGWDMGQLITDWGLEKKAFLTDKTAKMIGDVHVPPSELRNYYCLSDVHALSSGGEGFGIPMVEAMACGLPNVATDYTTTKEFLCDIKRDPAGKPVGVEPIRGIPVPYVDIEHHYTGGIWALVDTGKMADAFQTLYEDPNLRHKMGTSARQLAVEHYDAKRIKSLWIEVFENAPQFVEELKDSVAEDTGLKAVRFTV